MARGRARPGQGRRPTSNAADVEPTPSNVTENESSSLQSFQNVYNKLM